MKHNDPIKNIMVTDTVSVHCGQKISEVRMLMSEYGIHHVPVLDGEKLAGMLSMSDILKLSYTAYGTDQREVDAALDQGFSLDEVMIHDVVTVSDKGMVRDAAEILGEGRFHAVPVVDADKKLVGIVSSTDLIRYLLDQY